MGTNQTLAGRKRESRNSDLLSAHICPLCSLNGASRQMPNARQSREHHSPPDGGIGYLPVRLVVYQRRDRPNPLARSSI